jgi:hypothetical protein
VVSSVSLIGSICILLAYSRYTSLRKFSFKLVALLSLSDVLNHIADMLGPPPASLAEQRAPGATISVACWAQAAGNSIFELSSVLWTGAIAATLYAQVWLGWRQERVEALFPRMLLVCFGAPVILFLLPLVFSGVQVVGPSGAPWCWLRPEYPGWIFGIFYVPLWLVMIFNAVIHMRTSAKLRELTTGHTSTDPVTASRLAQVMSRLKYYPFVLLVVWLPASISRLAEAINGGRSIFALVVIQRIFSSSQGFLNFLAYGLSRGVREAIAEDLVVICGMDAVAAPHVELTLSAEQLTQNNGGK